MIQKPHTLQKSQAVSYKNLPKNINIHVLHHNHHHHHHNSHLRHQEQADIINATMAAREPVVERDGEEERKEEEGNEKKEEEGGERDVEKGGGGGGGGVGVSVHRVVEESQNIVGNEEQVGYHLTMLQRLNPSNPLRIVINGNTRVATPPPPQPSLPRTTPTPTPSQPSLTSLNSRRYTNKITLFLFVLHMVVAIGLVGFLVFKGIQALLVASDSVKRKETRILKHFLPQVEVACLLSITLAFIWQMAVRIWPRLMVHFILWCSFLLSLSAGILLICFQTPTTYGVGVCLFVFAICNGLYACWVNPRIGFCTKILIKSLEPVSNIRDLNHPTYYMLAFGFLWISLWILAVIGALNFYSPPLIIIALILSLFWTAEVMRNVVNLTVSRAIVLYYLMGIESNTMFCFQRALSWNLGSACLGSLFVPAIEALRIVARGLNLLEGEDEFMFSCAHCCLHVMESIFRYGNGWAFVQIAAYGKGFVKASQDTWQLFERQKMVEIVDSDITSSICFLTGVCSGSICVIVVAPWTATVYKSYIASLSLLAFFVGYIMTRISMALPHSCVSCYYVCYAENPEHRLFDKTIKDRQQLIQAGRDVIVPTPRLPRRFRT